MNDLLTIAQIAERMGVLPLSVATYHQKAQRNRREDKEREVDMPAPDKMFGRTPTWKPETIDAWLAKRPPKPSRKIA